ncbi:MAG: hypothetical protein AAF970_02625 [Bacteroidota bacterium]
MSIRRLLLALTVCTALAVTGCDTDFAGDLAENQPPTTQLSVRDTSLVDNLPETERLTSTVAVSWTGDDPDGFIQAFELRFYDDSAAPIDDVWTSTTRNDTLILLPIPRGERVANVVVEVRAVDNEGLRDPTPARTVFPIQNTPPTLRLNQFELPPDTTFSIFSFEWNAEDPEGDENLAAIEVSLNDSTSFVRLPPDIDFATFVSNDDESAETDVTVFSGRGFLNTGVQVPGLRLDAENTLYVRAVDQTDTTSTFEQYSWFVKRQTSDVLFVNDFRKITAPTIQSFHLGLLRDYLPTGTPIDLLDVTQPFSTGNTGDLVRSDALPRAVDPVMRQTFARYRYIYWISSNTTNSIADNNLPFVAPVLDLFFENGGKMMVHSVARRPSNEDENLGNPAILLLPISDLVIFPDTVFNFFRLPRSRTLEPQDPLPGVGEALPSLHPTRLISDVLPFFTEGESNVPLYQTQFNAILREGNRQVPWDGISTIASISNDRRVALWGFPLVSETTGDLLYTGVDGDPDASREAVRMILRSLGFPE